MYRLNIKQIRLWVSKIIGRVRFSRRICQLDLFSMGASVWANFSKSADLFARRKRITGAYVSLRNGMPIAAATPHDMLIAIKTYLTPRFCAIKPPAIGDTNADVMC
jgi:hypothetical protein